MKYLTNPFKSLNRFELTLWITSLAVVTASYLIVNTSDILPLCASLIGVTALIFVAKGRSIGQLLTIVFSVFYGIISIKNQYYGEMITYLGMSAPMALVALISWIKNPYKNTAEVKVNSLSRKQLTLMSVSCVAVTIAFYFILRALGNASLLFSTLSVTTSFLASYLTALRSPYYALAYSANDIVLIILWIVASMENPEYVPMIACFVMFLANDLYGFYNWRKMKKRQK